MKTIEINLYEFGELSEKAQRHALEEHCDINTDYDWWDSVYMDAETIGACITSFRIDRGNYIDMEIKDSTDTAERILKEHGEVCGTYKIAKLFLDELHVLEKELETGTRDEDCIEEDIEELEDDFCIELETEYLSMLGKEYDWRTSEEAIKETILCNEYDFTEDGEIYQRS